MSLDQEIVDAAMSWWASKRPDSWTYERHLVEPEKDCTTEAEQRLAQTCAAMSQAEHTARAFLAGQEGRRRQQRAQSRARGHR